MSNLAPHGCGKEYIMLCNVTGTLYLPNGQLGKSRTIRFKRVDQKVKAEYLGAVVPDDVYTQSDNQGEVGFDILTGVYMMHVEGGYSVRAIVPDAATAYISDIIEAAAIPPEPPVWYQQALNARDEAVDAADRAEDAANLLLSNGNLASLAGLPSSANKLPYFSGQDVMALTDLTSQARSLLASTLLSRSGNNLVTAANARFTGGAVTQSNVDSTTGRLLKVGDFGIGGTIPAFPGGDLSVTDNSVSSGIYRYDTGGATPNTGGPSGVQRGSVIHTRRAPGGGETQLLVSETPSAGIVYTRSRVTGDWPNWQTLYSTANTTVDSNGFIKEASPIIRLFSDRIEEPVQPTGAVLTRQAVGVYTLTGTLGLAQDGWQIETPRDHNGNLLCHVGTSWDGQALTVTVSEPVWDNGRWIAGDAIDVPDGRWIDIRLHEDKVEADAEAGQPPNFPPAQ